MRIVVTGANGQVGRELIALGANFGEPLLPYDREMLDITDEEAVKSVINGEAPDLVINAAAYTNVDGAERHADLAFAVNSEGPRLLAQACSDRDIPLIHISTDYVFRGDTDRPHQEADTVEPLGAYAKSKADGEEHVRQCLERHIIVRTSWVFSKFGGNFVDTMLKLGSKRAEITVVEDQTGGPTSAASIARTLLKIAGIYGSNRNVRWGTYHYSNVPHVSWFQFAEKIFEIAYDEGVLKQHVKVRPIPTSEFTTIVKRPANSRLDCGLIEKQFGISSANWEQELRQAIRARKNDATWKAK